eukprot:c24492_g1_i2 orf=111-2744(-)
MGLFSQLTEILLHCPFDEKENYWLHPAQCQALCIYFSSNLERFFGTTLRPPSLDSSPSMVSCRRNSFSVFYDKTFLKLWSNRKVNKSSSATLGDRYSALAILEELRSTPNAIEELFRVVREAENYIQVCSNSEWWRTAFIMGFTTEVRDVHMHDLMWCIAGLKLALQTVRGVELESRAQFTRLGIAQCYAEMGELSSQASELIRCEEQDHVHLLSRLQQVKRKHDEMNFMRKMVMSTQEKMKHETVHFLIQKLGAPSHMAEPDNTSLYVRKLPQSMHICSEDLLFAPEPHVIARGNYTTVYEASWQGIKVATKQFDYDSCKEYFTYEAAVYIALQSPFIIQLYGWSVNSRSYSSYLVFELVKSNLATAVKEKKELKKPLQLPVVLDLMLQLSRAMEYLHSKKIMHKDLRPSNVLVQPLSSSAELMEKGYGRVKLCNFGFDRLNTEALHLSILVYRAPEVWALHDRNRVEQVDYSFEADVYSFGMTFAYCLTGEDPFASITSKAKLREELQKGASPDLCSRCPLLLEELLQKCWCTDPSVRPSFSSITMALRHLKLLMMKSRSSGGVWDRSVVDKEFSLSTPVISYRELCIATNDFANRVQNISLHCMYHGVLSDGTQVLIQQMQEVNNIRKLWLQTSQLLKLRHSNVTGLRAVCIHASQYWFVYEHSFVQGSLDRWLEEDDMQERLDVATCYKIAVGAACGLQYLHAQGNVYALTSENILLDKKYEPQLLVCSVLCEERENLEYHQRLDVLHFGTLITRLLSYLRRNAVDLESLSTDSQAFVLKRVEELCVHAQMDEVVEVLESVYDSCHEDNLLFSPSQGGPLDFQESLVLDRDVDDTRELAEGFTSLFDLTQDLVDYNDTPHEPVDRRGSRYVSI